MSIELWYGSLLFRRFAHLALSLVTMLVHNHGLPHETHRQVPLLVRSIPPRRRDDWASN